jgi:hypothetical protein
MSSTFKDLRVWNEGMKFTVEIYRSTALFPRHEIYGLSQQLRPWFSSGSSDPSDDRKGITILKHRRKNC